ncbi:MAG: histidine--tRNA ligase [Clostridiales bacterium]|nr:histidine--tRNA ligase [Clostridiales bacterium]MCF8021108.1 histidine--tRNA ligase [Clostridiales bacterium]
MLTNRPRGTNDILPGQVEKWQLIEETMRCISAEYNYQEIRTPIFEHTELFIRGVGETTDIVEKEMYTFVDRGERSVTLRPEGTAPVVRSYLENRLNSGPQPVKLYYTGPMFRYDRPQSGRYRQFHQVGVEAFGSHHPALDAEVMSMAMEFYRRIGLVDVELHINSVGCPECRPQLKEKLCEYFRPRESDLCSNCRQRLVKNPLRIIDCKNPGCQEIAKDAPTPLDHLCSDCKEHFDSVCEYLKALGIPFVINPRLVRGLDYYTHTAFEIMAKGLGAQSSVGGGGRYNRLIEECGGPSIPGIGYALGVERIILALEQQGVETAPSPGPDVFVAILTPDLKADAFKILSKLRKKGISSDQDYLGRSLKAQMKYASKINAKYTIIVGNDELEREMVILREMDTGEQSEVPVEDAAAKIKERLASCTD